MTDTFRKKIKESLGNPILRAALDAFTEKQFRLRDKAFASLPDYQERRQRAHDLRAEVIAGLDSYLDRFIAQARQNGFIVHRAQDGAQAAQTVLEIARRHHAKRIAKGKSMVSEEIKLNQALEAAGIDVKETDLGEYIVQLRGETPSHIIAPAVHLNRTEVAELFHEKLGMPRTQDVPVMVGWARKTLREIFLKADIGISGVNFAVAETGTLCLVTNEGNGRMVTTLPPVHIALMGMERLVRTMEDLALMLSLLPRAASRQKISVYVSLMNRPKQPDDPDGPLERHIVILDNGRGRLRQSPLVEALYCIRCGSCLNVCPIFREIGGHAYVSPQGESSIYPGPIGSVIAPVLFGMPAFGHLARASTLCGACREACPVDIDLPKLLLRVRAGDVDSLNDYSCATANPPRSPFTKGDGERTATLRFPPLKSSPLQNPSLEKNSLSYPPLEKGGRGDFLKNKDRSNAPRYLKGGLKFYKWTSIRPSRFRRAQKTFFLLGLIRAPFSTWINMPGFTRWGFSKDFPRPALSTFRSRFKSGLSADVKADSKEVHENSEPPTFSSPILTQAGSPRDRFIHEWTALDGKVVTCKSGELGERIFELLKTRKIDTIAAWEEKQLPTGLIGFLKAKGVQVLEKPDSQTRVGLTGTPAAVADTGTLIIPGGHGQPLTVSLLPEIHLAVLCERDIHENLAEVLKLPAVRQASAVAMVSGPSRTADIEMTLTLGAHGPAEVHVFCYEE
ncbi:MAG: hypothetical protein EHM45_10325 [Desulfobacteraceae bacterium]|nr:MAG: hypothetical protein EHM45_10325 [Desulfobacteraceae bacterium]